MISFALLVSLAIVSTKAMPGGASAGNAGASAGAGTPGTMYGVPGSSTGSLGGGGRGVGAIATSYGGGAFGGAFDGPSVPIPYDFDYGVNSGPTVFGQRENGDGRDVSGSYFVNLPDGRRQRVDYVADARGYQATVSYQGTASHPASFSTGSGTSFGVGSGTFGNYGGGR